MGIAVWRILSGLDMHVLLFCDKLIIIFVMFRYNVGSLFLVNFEK